MDNILKFDYYYGDEAEQFSFYRVPRLIIKDDRFKSLSNDAKLLYGLMLDNLSLSKRNGWLDEENRVYIHYTIEAIQDDLNCSCGKAVSMVKELINFGLIEKKRMGQGKADIIYVKNFVLDGSVQNYNSENTEKENSIKKSSTTENSYNQNSINKNSKMQNSKNQNSKIEKPSTTENESLELQNLEANYNNINNTNLSYTNPIYPSGNESKETDAIDETQKLMDLVKDNIRYEDFMLDSDYRKKDLFEEVYNTIIDLVCVSRKTIRISGEDYPYTMVKDRMLKLNSSHVEYVIDKIEKNTKEITNIKAYLITALYNAPTTFNIYLSQRIQHDLYGED